MSKVDTKAAREGAKFKLRKADGSVAFPINDCSDVRKAWDLRNNAEGLSSERIVSHIRRAAKELGCNGPWSVQQENWLDVGVTLSQESIEVVKPPILQEGQEAPDWVKRGAMRIRFPFIVGESISRTPGIEEEIYFPTRNVAQAVGYINQEAASGRQPLTVYARHNHATSMDYLPIGGVVSAEDNGRVGHAIAEIEPTSVGKDVQILLEGKKLNAMSLRAAPGLFELTPKEVNNVLRLEVDLKGISGIDFAPDGPAMPTWGIETLAAEASVGDPKPVSNEKEDNDLELTLEALRSDHSSLVAEIEAPMRQQITKLEQERADLRLKNEEATRDLAVSRLAMHFPEPVKAFEVLQEFCKDAKSEAEVAVKAQPVLLEAVKRGVIKANEPVTPTKPDAELVMERLFPQATPNGSGKTDEKPNGDGDEKPVLMTQEKVGQGMPALPF